MKITAVTVWQRRLPLAEEYRLSGGRLRFTELDATFVRIDTDANLVGWGEATPWGHTYLPAHGSGVRAALELLAPAVIGRDPRATDDICRTMDVALPGHPYAKSAIDMACWDALGRAVEMPLWRLFGAEQPHVVQLSTSLATADPEQMRTAIEAARAEGYRVHSAKIGGADIDLDIARIRAIDAALQPGETVTYDVNRAWTPDRALQVLHATRDAKGWVEQPCETLSECAQIAQRVNFPVLLDECMHRFEDHLMAWQQHACAGVKVKPNRLGGLTRARQVRDFGVAVGWNMHIEDVGGTVLADTAAIHLAAATPPEHNLSSWLCHRHLADDPMPGQGARFHRGTTTPPDLPGIGVTPDEHELGPPVAQYTETAS